MVEKILQVTESESQSRGIKSANDAFDNKYDFDYIYLHIVGSEDALYIPLYTVQCETNKKCLCFRYHIRVFDDGSATISLVDEVGNITSSSLNIPNGSMCYFSSIPESVWELKESGEKQQIYPKSKYNLYRRDDTINKEIYRSKNNFSIHELTECIEGLLMRRACSGFTVFGLFYDEEELNENSDPWENVVLEKDEFETIMQSQLSQWYIKIYIGGKTFVKKYDFGTMSPTTNDKSTLNYGYYSTGNFSEEYSNYEFIPLEYKLFGYNIYRLECFGYLSPKNIRLLTPVLKEELEVYILIKKWEGEGEPTQEWLVNDEDALYTQVDLSGYALPENDHFYSPGLLMDIRQFEEAWRNAQTSRSSRSANGMHYFELKDAKVIFEKY